MLIDARVVSPRSLVRGVTMSLFKLYEGMANGRTLKRIGIPFAVYSVMPVGWLKSRFLKPSAEIAKSGYGWNAAFMASILS